MAHGTALHIPSSQQQQQLLLLAADWEQQLRQRPSELALRYWRSLEVTPWPGCLWPVVAAVVAVELATSGSWQLAPGSWLLGLAVSDQRGQNTKYWLDLKFKAIIRAQFFALPLPPGYALWLRLAPDSLRPERKCKTLDIQAHRKGLGYPGTQKKADLGYPGTYKRPWISRDLCIYKRPWITRHILKFAIYLWRLSLRR
jgi:hypothetical protein